MSGADAMREQALDLPRQLRSGLAAADAVGRDVEGASAVALCGLGGSAAGGRLLAALMADRLAVPLVAVDGPALPGWVGRDALVVCTSYSGATVETRAAWDEAGRRGARRVAIASGGPLAAAAAEAGAPCVVVEGGFQPRGALGLLVGALAGTLDGAGAVPGAVDRLLSALPDVEAAAERERSDPARARHEAEALAGAAVALYGAGPRAAAALRLKNQINENAKVAAFAGAVPEVAHNEVLGWLGVARHGLPLAAVVLRDPDDAQPALLDAIQRDLEGDAATVLTWRAEGASEFGRTLALLVHGDAVSCALAEVEGVDALDIARLTALKASVGGA